MGKHPACRRPVIGHRKLEAYATETATRKFSFDEALFGEMDDSEIHAVADSYLLLRFS